MFRVTLLDLLAGRPYPPHPFFLDIKMYDTETTVIAALKNLPKNCVKVSVRIDVGIHVQQKVIDLCKRKEIEAVFI